MAEEIYISTILNNLLTIIPVKETFNLYELAKAGHFNYEAIELDGLKNNEHIYSGLSLFLVNNDFAKYINEYEIKLTKRGRKLKELGSWESYQKRISLENKATVGKLIQNAKWFYIALLITFISSLINIATELFKSYCLPNKNQMEKIIIIKDTCLKK